jgi:hypothetical protein
LRRFGSEEQLARQLGLNFLRFVSDEIPIAVNSRYSRNAEFVSLQFIALVLKPRIEAYVR